MNGAHLGWPFFDAPHRALAASLADWSARSLPWTEHADVDAECRRLVRLLGEAGWLRYCVPAAHGGALVALDARSLCIARETLAYHDGLADFVFAMQGLGSGAITLAGTEAQKARWLPRVAQGDAIAAFALSEPGAGSDVAAMSTRVRRDGAHFVLDGVKTFISNGGIADFYCVFARTGNVGGTRDISAFVVPADSPGLLVAERIETIAPHPLARLEFRGCRVGAGAQLGGEGEGFKLAMRTLDIFRVSVAAAAVGFARRALAESIGHARARPMFGATLANRELTQAKLADMATAIDAAALLTCRAAWQADVQKTRATKEVAMAKMTATESAQQVIDAAVQLFGGLGVTRGQVVERLYREIRALRIYEGATEVQKLIVARELLDEIPGKEAMTARIDTFARDHLPPRDQWPELIFELPELSMPARMNVAAELLDHAVLRGWGDRTAILAPGGLRWTYRELLERANRIARVLVEDMGLVPGNRVLLRAPNNPMVAACWFGVLKAGGIAVGTMPLLRAKELTDIVTKAEISHALCDARLAEDLDAARPSCPTLQFIALFGGTGVTDLETRMATKSPAFDTIDTAADDTCVIAFTSGTTGKPKGTMHFHRDLIAACRCWPPHVLHATADDIFTGSPPLAFTFGLGGLLLFPLSIGAAALLVERPAPDALAAVAAQHRATVLFTAPTSYRAMAPAVAQHDLSALRKCVSAGEALPASTRKLWKDATGIEIIDGIGATEMFHIFISHDEASALAGATGTVVPGYRACVMDDAGRLLPAGKVGRLAVKGPTGCRYLADDRQASYVRDGWNYTGDAYVMDAKGYFTYQGRTDDMIISAGYNIGGPEVESALLAHPAVAECGVVASPDAERGQIVKAFVVLRPGFVAGDTMTRDLQDFVKREIAPYKYPRAIDYLENLPRTGTGKLQRARLRTLDEERRRGGA